MNSLGVPITCLWALTVMTFSLPGRDGPNTAGSLDVIALGKLGVRFLSLILLGVMVLRRWHTKRMQVILGILLPFWIYLGWAFASASWSALPAVSLGQAIGLLVLLLLAVVVGATCDNKEDLESILKHLAGALLVVGTLIVAVDVVDHERSGLDRDEHVEDGALGIVHPTSAGATASLGLVVVVGCGSLWGWSWTRWLLLPTLVILGWLLIVAASRMAMIMGLVVLGLILLRFSPGRILALAVFLGSLLGLGYLALDPDLDLVELALRRTGSHVSRGESAESMSSLTGRTALWEAIHESWLRSPLIGHGYFVTSHNGLLDVWSGPANRSAHNVFLQVLVTTGVVGLALFLWALGSVITAVWRGARARTDREANPLPAFLVVMGLWYLGWSQLCESFMGPIQPEAVVFYVLLGLGLALASRESGEMEGTTA